MKRFKDKVAIITGGGTGIGRAVAEGLVAGGGKVLITGRREAPLQELSNQYPDSVQFLQMDVAKPGSSNATVHLALETFGRLDILINNAAHAVIKPLSELSDDEIDQMLAVNLKALLALSRDATLELTKSRGAIINISTVAAQSAVPGFTAYAATKAAGDRLTRILANELGPLGVRVNSVAPGLTNTAMVNETPAEVIDHLVTTATALRRLGEVDDVARVVLWLASEDAGWVTGQVLQASGGLLLS